MYVKKNTFLEIHTLIIIVIIVIIILM